MNGAEKQAATRDVSAARVEGTEPTGRTPASERAGEPERTDLLLRTFVRDGRLVRLPARWQRKLVVLRYVAERTFEPGIEYPERTVNEKLRAWCEDAPVDHVTLRRYLVDLGHLQRHHGSYWVPDATPAA